MLKEGTKAHGVILARLLIAGLLLFAAVVGIAGIPGTPGDTTADIVLGQSSFATANTRFTSAVQLAGPWAAAIDTSVSPNRLFIADAGNHRVLGFKDVSSLVNGKSPDLVIGQPDFVSNKPNQGGANPTAATLFSPTGVAVDSNGNLYVADFGNNRVLEYDSPFTTDTTADMVFGELGSFTTRGGVALSADSLSGPDGLTVDSNDNLYVADTSANRVLEYDTPKASGNTTADRVFGQADAFNLANCNGIGLSAKSLCGPMAVARDASDNIYIADTNNSRVLEYDSPLTTDTTADRVFGQLGSFTTNLANNGGLNANSLLFPRGVGVDASGNLYVSDGGNDRVLEYNSPLTTDTTADRVFGQLGSFTTNTANNGGISADSMSIPGALALDSSGGLYLPDNVNNRLLVYRTPLPPPLRIWSLASRDSPTTSCSIREA